jgi:asparaginyl-tRNA synthetase
MLLKDIKNFLNQEVILQGWIFNFRSSGSIYFLQFRDGTGRIQAIVSRADVSTEVWENCQKLTMESSVEIKGVVYEEARSPYGYEIKVNDLKIIHLAEKYPIAKKEHGIDFLLDYRHLWIRSPRQEAILKIRDGIVWAIREFFHKKNFILTDSPILTRMAAEGTTNLFEVNYFDEKAYLAQTGQLYLEATSAALGRTYSFGPTFRAEKSKTRRHLSEFWMVEAEASFMDFEENLKLQEELVEHIVKYVLENYKNELNHLGRDIEPLKKITAPFYRLTYDEVIKKLNELGSDIKWGEDLGGDDETILTKQYDKPIFVTHYPAEVKAFYMKPDPKNPKVVLNDDLLAPEGYGEIIGGSERDADLKSLEKKVKEQKLPLEYFNWYLDLRRYGSVPHSGFGLGLERTVAWICGLDHVREAIPFPRMLNRIEP